MLLLRCVGSHLQLPQTGIVVSQCSFLPACCCGLVPDGGFQRLNLLCITQQQGHATHLSCLGKVKRQRKFAVKYSRDVYNQTGDVLVPQVPSS
jgi:hypothetical protein